ncbi:thioredoxin family protein [Akkermansiaceae bacterium]|nr:thioredoxin family protein [Akkermansiaceae bacterium]
MNKASLLTLVFAVLISMGGGSFSALGQSQASSIAGDKITELGGKLAKASEAGSAARKKLAIRRVIREGDALIKENATAPNRFEILSILFRSQQALVSLDNSTKNRKAFLETSKKLAAAPNEYAALRLDSDLLLTQAESARKGADSHARADALRPLVERYRDTDVEPKVIRIAMIMALELGNTKLVNDLRKVVAERFPGNMDLINFQREKLAGQVFGAPFIGTFERSDGTMARFPMDFLGITTAIYCWSKEGDGLEDLKALAADWKKAKVEHNAAGRFQFVSMNMDDLPDAGEGILREHGLDWQALKMPKGQENPIYQTYVKRDTPTIAIVSPNGYVALYQSGGAQQQNL